MIDVENKEQVIFAIDNQKDIHALAKAIHTLDVLRAAHVKGPIVPCLGYYDGQLEYSFMVERKQWDDTIHKSMLPWVKDQKSFLYVPHDVRLSCRLYFPAEDTWVMVGRMVEITEPEMSMFDSWTYVIETGRYFTTVGG